jgi:hypothetical protein
MSEESIGIAIGGERLRSLAADYLARIEAGDDALTADDFVTMIRLWNTIESGRLREQDATFDRYAAAFFPHQVQRATDVLGMTPTKGMALYSREHDVYLGGRPHANSQYRIED